MASFLSTRAKKSIAIAMDFFICVRRTQHHLTEGQHHCPLADTNERCCLRQMMCFAMMWAYAQ